MDTRMIKTNRIPFYSVVRKKSGCLTTTDHTYPFKHRNNFVIHKMRRSKSQSCWPYQSISLFNSLTITFHEVRTDKKFINTLKYYLLSG